jgi:hypothetical protein
MSRLRHFILGCLTLVAATAWSQEEASPLKASGQHVKIFVLTGQSNSLGTTADKKEPDITPGKDTLDAQIPFFWANRSSRSGDGAAKLYDDSGGKIVTLRAQKGDGANPLFWGPEIGFARHLAAKSVKDFLFVKASRGGGGNSYWLKGSRDDHMYRHVVETVQQAIHALPQGVTFEVAALLYIQGESDNPAEAAASGERLKTLAENLRKDLPKAAAMKVIIGGIASGGEKSDVVSAQQSALAKNDPTFRYIDTLDLRGQRYDNLHFSKGAKLEIGQRMAKVWLEWSK